MKRHTLSLLLSLVLVTPSTTRAAAYYVGEIGARSIARGGANLVNPGDPSAVWLNPAAITLSTGVQLQLDLNLVWLSSEFVRDCGGEANGCAPLADVERTYRNPTTGEEDPARRFRLTKGSRVLGETFSPGDGSSIPVDPAEPGTLGDRNTPSRFDGKTGVRNEAGVQPIPRVFATFNTDSFGIDGIALGAYVYAPSAGDYKFSETGPTRYTLIDRDLLEVYYGLTVAYRFENWIAIGASLQGVTSGLNQSVRLSGDGAGNEDPDYDVQVRIQGVQHLIPSGNVGVWTKPLHPLGIDLELGASLQLQRHVVATGPLTIESIGPGLQQNFFDSGLATLDAEGATATAEFTLPPFWRIGAKYGIEDVFNDGKNTFGFDIEIDGVIEQWSTYDHVFLTTKDLTFAVGGGDPEPLPPVVQPKDWTDAWSVRAGTTLAFFDRALEVHGGGFYETSAIPNETYTIEVADGDKVGFGAGISGRFAGVRVDVAYAHVLHFEKVVGQESYATSGNVAIPPPVGADSDPVTRVAMGRYTASHDMLNIGLTVAFDEMLGFGVHAPKAAPTPPAAEPVSPTAPPAPATTPAPTPAPEAPSAAEVPSAAEAPWAAETPSPQAPGPSA